MNTLVAVAALAIVAACSPASDSTPAAPAGAVDSGAAVDTDSCPQGDCDTIPTHSPTPPITAPSPTPYNPPATKAVQQTAAPAPTATAGNIPPKETTPPRRTASPVAAPTSTPTTPAESPAAPKPAPQHPTPPPTATPGISLTPAAVSTGAEPTAASTPAATPQPSLTATAGPAEIAWVDSPDCDAIEKKPFEESAVTLYWPGGQQVVLVEVASTGRQRSQGLMCRASVPAGRGMIFLFETPTNGGFWMFNTYTPLDILFLDDAGRLVWSDTMTPCPRQSVDENDQDWSSRCSAATTRPPAESGAYVAALELPAGWLEEIGIAPGETNGIVASWE